MRRRPDESRKWLGISLHHYLEERILVSSWYPEADGLALIATFIKVTPELGKTPWQLVGRVGAREHAAQTYRHLIEARDPTRVVQRAHVLWRAFHDTGELDTTIESPGVAHLELSAFAPLCEEYLWLLTGYLPGIIDVAGASKANCTVIDKDIGAKRAVFRLTWEPPAA